MGRNKTILVSCIAVDSERRGSAFQVLLARIKARRLTYP